MKEEITQGSIICGVRSDNYPNMHCFGIIVTARCNVANCKVPNLYYLTALNLEEWLLTEVGFNEVLRQKINSNKNEFTQCAQKNNLNAEILCQVSTDEYHTIVDDYIKDNKALKELNEKYEKYISFSSNDKQATIKREKNMVTKSLEAINKGDFDNIFYLPKKACKNNNVTKYGFIVDLQDIERLSLDIAEKIQENGVDYQIIKGNPKELIKFNEKFWMESDTDFVIVYDKISSPWIELLMQRFAHSFTRIGVDGVSKSDLISVVENL